MVVRGSLERMKEERFLMSTFAERRKGTCTIDLFTAVIYGFS
jgi:hypothetical protein